MERDELKQLLDGALGQLHGRIDASLERERLFREDFSARILHELRAHIDQLFARIPRAPPLVMVPGARIFTHTVDGHRVLLDPTEPFITYHVLEHGEWEGPLRNVFRALLRPGGSYVDVGANIGLHTLFASMLIGVKGKVLALEPHPTTQQILRDNIEINGMVEYVEIIGSAVGEKDGGTTSFEYFPQHSAMSGFKLTPERIALFQGTPEQIDVPLVSLDALLDRAGFVPDLVKIDIEGFELQAMTGATKLLASGSDTAFVIEFDPRSIVPMLGADAPKTLIDMFLEAGFRGFVLHEKGIRPITFPEAYGVSGDLIFLRNESALLEREDVRALIAA